MSTDAVSKASALILNQFPGCAVSLESVLAEDNLTAVPTLFVETPSVSVEFAAFLDGIDAQFADHFYVCARLKRAA